MEQKLYFKHSLVISGEQNEVESEINVFNNEDTKVVNVTVTPERVEDYTMEGGIKLPRWIYHVCIVYTDRRS